MTDKTDSNERAGRFTKKPVTIDAWLIDFGNKPLPDWVNEAFRTEAIDWCPAGEGLYINTLEGHMLGANGSWLIKGVQGELYACKPDIFAATYERASLAASAGSEPVAWRISCPDEPDLGFWLAEEDGGEGFLSEPLYTRTAPPAAGQDARPCHVFTVRKAGPLTEWAATTMAFALPDGEHALYTDPSPPEGMVGGWMPIESFSEDDADEVLAWKPGVGRIIITWLPEGHPDADEGEGWHEAWSHKRVRGITHGMLPPAPPTSSADSRKGE